MAQKNISLNFSELYRITQENRRETNLLQNAINNLGKCVVRLLACLVIFAENVI